MSQRHQARPVSKVPGTAGVVLSNGSMGANASGEGEIRAQIVEADLVSCMVTLPTQLFRATAISACLWFFAKNKGKGVCGSTDRSGQILFIDARRLGYMTDRAERSLADSDITRIASTFHAWRGTESAREVGLTLSGLSGLLLLGIAGGS
jgi:type I restriction enzyme M protein